MDEPVKIGERLSWGMAGGDCVGTVRGVETIGARQLVAVLADDGSRHSLVVGPSSRGGTDLLAIYTNHAEAVALARNIIAGQEPRMPPQRQVLTLAAALVWPDALPIQEETDTDE